ncbi:DNA-binding SARP family transcriptional activator [Hamadaea flava]|uniref:BTAD domain-containing putative transcriptional regulator n=1 Tax=Hamadaea flava TaxID=1742688 RepID=A0ABV8LLZ8_9ACTN|nr:BTAD domain-containing putative transcriptional regulator [Hamadaea flava]MCP2325045.1 DNA-binding SARP family transcriptional activator [Hamadaea flava]
MGLEFRLLGPFEVRDDDRPVPINGVKPRQLLASLLLHPDRPVSVDRLIEVLWPIDPPRSAAANIQTYISGLRTCLGDDHVVRYPPGYAVVIGPADLDVASFLRETDEAIRLRRLGYLADAQRTLESALARWRGSPLADLPPSPLWQVELDQLTERRLAALSELLDLRIRLGDPDRAVAELRGLTAEHPLREGLWALLIRALVAAGRRADALTVYAEVRHTLAEELGVGPGPELQRLHNDLLAADATPIASHPVGQQLPADAAIVLRGLAAFGDATVPAWFAGALLEDGEEQMDRLVSARLAVDAGVDALGQRRYRVPVLVRMLADAQSGDWPQPDEAGLVRVLGGLLSLAEDAGHALPHSPFGPGQSVAPRWKPPMTEVDDPVAWFVTEQDILLTAIEVAGRLNRPDFAWELALATVPWCDLAGHPEVWETGHQTALAICRRLDDQLGVAVTLRGLGQLHLYRDEYAQADAAFGRARLLFAQLGQPAGVAAALSGLGAVHRVRGELDLAVDYYSRALEAFVECAEPSGEAYARGAIGQVWLARGNLDRAQEWLESALNLAEVIGDRHRTAHLRQALGSVARREGREQDARGLLDQALAGFTTIGDIHGEAYALVELGRLEQTPAEAADRLTRALHIYQRLGDRRAEADTAERLGQLHGAAGQRELAAAYLDEARRLRAQL